MGPGKRGLKSLLFDGKRLVVSVFSVRAAIVNMAGRLVLCVVVVVAGCVPAYSSPPWKISRYMAGPSTTSHSTMNPMAP